MMKKSDILLTLVAGEMIAFFSLPIIYNNFAETISFTAGAIAAIILLPVISVAGLLVANFLSKFFAPFWRLSKFILIGFLNTIIDVGIFNLMIIITGVTSGFLIGGVNIPGFSIAVLNSYNWNKRWVFKDTSNTGSHSDFFSFMAVTLGGLLINSSIAIFLTTYLDPAFGMNDTQWATLSKILAAMVNFVWNFTGYKLFVFRKKTMNITPIHK